MAHWIRTIIQACMHAEGSPGMPICNKAEATDVGVGQTPRFGASREANG